jgi:hypothetical protein
VIFLGTSNQLVLNFINDYFWDAAFDSLLDLVLLSIFLFLLLVLFLDALLPLYFLSLINDFHFLA